MPKIKGGYILQPRVLDESWISKSPPHVREIWLYLLRKANHKDVATYGRIIKRGQLKTSYRDIIEDLSWSVGFRKESYKKHHCDTAMRLLVKQHMVTTARTTRGIIVTICNYDYYQDPKNYETDSDTSYEPTRDRHETATINKNDKNDKKNTNNKFDFKKALLDYEFDEMLVDEWLVIRKAKKSVNSQFAFNSFISQVEKTSMDKNEVLKIVAEKQWAGFNSNWLKNLNRNNGKDRRDSEAADRERQIMQLAREAGMA